MEGLGVGFLSFLDSIEKTVKAPLNQFKKKNYDFNDDEKEVALGESDLEAPAGNESSSHQDFDIENNSEMSEIEDDMA